MRSPSPSIGTHFLIAGTMSLALLASACSPSDSAPSAPEGRSPDETNSTTITVFATASLTAAFTDIGEAFMLDNPDTSVNFNFAGSSELVTQINQGAPADVFASADPTNMTKLVDAGNTATKPVMFTTNLSEIIVGPGNPRGITGIADLANEQLIVVLCSPQVPCGNYAEQIIANAGVRVVPKSLEANVNAVATKVILGEADAGIVYRTDVIAAGSAADGVEIPAEINVVAQYLIARTNDARNPIGAEAFIDFVTGDIGQQILASHGFSAS